MMSSEATIVTGWAVELRGHNFDLADWHETLTSPFDPWVEHHDDTFLLRAAEFNQADTADEVRERARVLVEKLNGAMAVSRSARPLHFEGVIELRADGTQHTHMFAEGANFELRSRLSARAEVIDPNGQVVAPDPPRMSEAQEMISLGNSHPALADALVYVSRPGWFDTYKAIESLEEWAEFPKAVMIST